MINFVKMEGLGNDYVYIYDEYEKMDNLGELSIKMSDRHFGVGSDGIIIISNSSVADFKMRIFNADGSEAEMCGNGIRCAGKYVYDNKLTDKSELDIKTKAGIKHLSLHLKNSKVDSVTVDMGEPIFESKKIPVNYFGDSFVKFSKSINDRVFILTCVSMGNPHAVCFLDNLDEFDIVKYGPLIECDDFFPNRTNVEFIEVLDKNNIKMRVWERGSSETLACGTGACASVCAAVLNGYTDRNVNVILLGGSLMIEWKNNNHVYMTGPCRDVFSGVYFEN